MPSPYSVDLREKALAAVNNGARKSDVSRMFNISRNTLDLWIKRAAATGSVAPKTYVRRGPAPKIQDLDEFRQFVAEHRHLTARELAEAWPEPISDVTIGLALKRINFTRKKDLRLPRTR